MNFSLKQLCLSLTLILSFSARAAPTGEVIFAHPKKQLELWMSNLNGHNARQLFELPLLYQEISIQDGDRYLVVVAERVEADEDGFGVNAYLFDLESQLPIRKNRLFQRDITKNRFGKIIDAAISRNGNIIFTNRANREADFTNGLYFILNHELNERMPKAELLLPGLIGCVDWSPDGKDIVFNTADGIFRLNLFTKQVSLLIKGGYCAVFSPNGKQIAFFTRTLGKKIGIISLTDPHNVKILEIEDGGVPRYLTWSFDGQYIAYTLEHQFKDTPFSNFAVPVDGGKHSRILQEFNGGVPIFEWINKVYSINPMQSFITTWGQLKGKNFKTKSMLSSP